MIDANVYAEALFMLTEELGTSDNVLSDLKTVKKVLKENDGYAVLADTPAFPTEKRVELIDEAFGELDNSLVSLLKILSTKHSFYQVGAISDEYAKYYDESRNIERVTAVTCVPMTDEQTGRLKEKLSEETGKNIIIRNKVDKTILGGMVLRYGGIQRDGSYKARLSDLQATLQNNEC